MHRSIEEIKSEMLGNVSNTEDKTENSLIHDAIAPASIEFFAAYRGLENIRELLDMENLEGGELEIYIYQRSGLSRKMSTNATTIVRIYGEEGTVISEGMLVSTGEINFAVMENKIIGPGGYEEVLVKSETSGATGNVPQGSINELPVATQGITSVTNEMPATNGFEDEDDVSLIERYYSFIRTPATSGNKYHYLNWAKEVEGVGDAKVIPIWNGPGTVKVVIINANKQVADMGLVNKVKEHIEKERPIGANVTVESAVEKIIKISAMINKTEDFTLEQIKGSIKDLVNTYLKDIAFKQSLISYAKIGALILEVEGIIDYQDLLLNSSNKNIVIENEEIAVLEEVIASESVI